MVLFSSVLGNVTVQLKCLLLDFLSMFFSHVLSHAISRASAEQALSSLNGTQLGGQSIRLSWGRSPSSKQVFAYLSSFKLRYIRYCFDSDSLCRLTRLNGVVVVARIMGMAKDMRLMDMLHLLRTLICIMEITQDIRIISSHSRYDKHGLEGLSGLPFWCLDEEPNIVILGISIFLCL